MDGERELTAGLLSKEASFRLIVSGPVGVREIERLIRKLELDKEILAADLAALDATRGDGGLKAPSYGVGVPGTISTDVSTCGAAATVTSSVAENATPPTDNDSVTVSVPSATAVSVADR